MSFKNPLELPNLKLLEVIQKDLQEDPERLERQVNLFKEWLACEEHLPIDVDEHLILNFVRLCKCNLDKAKKKFENFLAIRLKWKQIHVDRCMDDKYFDLCNVHRQFVCHPKLTPEGSRLIFYRLPMIENSYFDMIMHYSTTILDYILFEDTSASHTMIYDFKGSTPQHIARINIKHLIKNTEIIYNASPVRVKHVHIFNLPKTGEAILSLVLKVVSEKISKRVTIHKDVKEITKCMPIDILPEEYGGHGGNLDKYGDEMRAFLTHNDEFAKKIDALKLAGPVPPHKTNIYSFEEYEMDGSFRKLNID